MDDKARARLDELVDRLQPLEPIRVVVFGSRARGTDDELSDLDVVVVARKVRTRFLDRLADAYDLIDPRYALDLLLYTPQEYEQMLADGNTLLEMVEREGRVIYERPAA